MAYKVVVYARRGSQPAYCYPVYDRVKSGKVERVCREVAEDILMHECRSGMDGWLTSFQTGAIVEVNLGSNRFVVRAWRI